MSSGEVVSLCVGKVGGYVLLMLLRFDVFISFWVEWVKLLWSIVFDVIMGNVLVEVFLLIDKIICK